MDNVNLISRNGSVVIVHKGWRTSENKKHSSISPPKIVPQRQEFKDTNADFDTPSVSPPLAPSKTTNVDKRFEFVNISKSARNRDPEVQKLVRSQVVKDLHRKKPKRPRIQTDTTVEQDPNTLKSPRQTPHSLLATVGLWVSVSHDQALFQTYAMTMGHSERSVLPESTICMSIPPAVGSSVECISFRAIAVLSRPPAPHT